jgi:transcriptional regulator with XRE-family HTH domain/predicted RNase H-like HicB family nuclease
MSSHPEVGSALRTAREASGLTQEKLGELSGIHATHISRIERAQSEPTLGTLVDLAVALKLEPDYFVRFRMPVGFRLAVAPRTPDVHSLAVHEPGQGQGSPSPPEFVVVIQRTRDGYSAFVPDLPGCTASGVTEQAAESAILKAGNDHLRGLRRAGRAIPAAAAYATRMTFDA